MRPIFSRRDFLKASGLAAVAGSAFGCARPAGAAPIEGHEARFYDKLDGGLVRCRLCPWQCVVPPGQRGRCGVRENRNGRYVTLVYGRPCAINNDPIEKKPFFHVLPGSTSLSLATVGCNIHCRFCQNWDISQAAPESVKVPYRAPADIAALAHRVQSRTIAYTYSEPTIFFEYMADCAAAAREAGLGNVVVSNGFISAEPAARYAELMTAVKIDLKAFTESFYRDVCAGRLEPVKETLKRLAGNGVWLEIVVLIIPTLNDDMDDIARMCNWIATELGPDVPLHFTRFHNAYKIRNLHSTPPRTLQQARETARKAGLHFVYTGNLPGTDGEHTRCPDCGELLVKRYGFVILENRLVSGTCPACQRTIPGVWQ